MHGPLNVKVYIYRYLLMMDYIFGEIPLTTSAGTDMFRATRCPIKFWYNVRLASDIDIQCNIL